MKGISIIFGFKNREKQRVKNCLDSLSEQSFNDFEVVFVDYGSDDQVSVEIEKLLAEYKFASYYYNNTQGMPWNRGHALNTGVRLAKNDYILFGDVDLIYSPDVLQALAELAWEDVQVYSPVYFLPEGQTDLNFVLSGDWQTIPRSDENGKGGVHLLAKKHLERIGGYDEYYCFWGVEDRDLYSRLDQLGIISKWIDNDKYPVFHQWHPDVSGAKRGFFPDRWWQNMNIHFQVNINVLERNNKKWGKLYSIDDRPVFTANNINFEYSLSGNWFYRGRIAALITQSIQELNPGECLKIKVPNSGGIKRGILSQFNKLLKSLPGNLVLLKNETNRFQPETDLFYIIWRLIKDEGIIKDYSIVEGKSGITIKLIGKNHNQS